MRLAVDDGEFAEVLVERDQDPYRFTCKRKNRGVARILFPGSRPHDIVPGLGELLDGTSLDAGIEEEPHQADSAKGSRRSCRTSRRA